MRLRNICARNINVTIYQMLYNLSIYLKMYLYVVYYVQRILTSQSHMNLLDGNKAATGIRVT